MADVSKIKLPDGTTYNIKDTTSGYITPSDIADKTDKLIVHLGDPISGDFYQIDKTYQQIGWAVLNGDHLLFSDGNAVYPYLGFGNIDGTVLIGFGFSATYNGTAMLHGYAVLQNDTAMKLNSFTDIPTSVSQLTNDSGFITNETESDPTVPSWAKASTKPTYTASEVGAVPTSRTINGKSLSNDITLDASDIGINPASIAPNMDGTPTVGSSAKYAREDHVHPSDTSRVPTTRKINGLDLTSDRNIITQTGTVSTGGHSLSVYIDGNDSAHTHEVYDAEAVNGMFAYANTTIAQNFVPKTTTVNGNALSGNITLDADDVSAIPTSTKGAASGVCPLDANSKVDSQYLPSYLIKGNTGGVFYGTCSTAAGTVAKVVECADFTADNLKAGAIIIVSFTTTNSGAVANLTMNVNNTGAKPIKYINNGTLGNLSSAGYLKAGTEYPFYYDGNYWVCWFNVNTTYSALSEADMKAGTATASRLISAARLKEAVEYHAPVTSVNGSTGDVTVTVPTKTSELTNDSGFITSAPVTSVNGRTGAVTINVPTQTSELTNNGEDGSSGFVTGNDVTDLVDFSLLSPTFCATDATTQAVLQQAFGASAEIVVPSNITSTTLLLHKLEPRTWFAWMNGTEMEFARMSVSVNTSNSAITLYLRGRTSIATGVMGVDSSWTVTPLASDAEGWHTNGKSTYKRE